MSKPQDLDLPTVSQMINMRPPPVGTECWYRCVDYSERNSGNTIGSTFTLGSARRSTHTVVELCKFKVMKHTPKGVRLYLSDYSHDDRLVLHDSRRKFAHPTKDEAIESFIKRKNSQLNILRGQIGRATDSLAIVSAGDIKVR